MSLFRQTKLSFRDYPLINLWRSRPLDFAAVAFWISVSSFLVTTTWDLGMFGALIGTAGTATCGFSWLLARALFRNDAGKEIWPLVIVGLLIGTGILVDLLAAGQTGAGSLATILGMANSVHALLSSTVLLLALVEAFLGFHQDLSLREKRFRITFASVYGGMLATSVIWLNGVPDGSWAAQSSDTIRIVCALIAVGLSIFAWQHRQTFPHPKSKRRQRQFITISDDDTALASRVRQLLEDRSYVLQADLKLANLAKDLREADYKVTNCITGILGYRNFNHMINVYRVEAAKSALRDPKKNDQSILMIALDCGFSSIGPFNRAFKQETQQTPSAYRAGGQQ